MKKIIAAAMGLLFLSTPVPAETMYVSDIVRITLRVGPGADHPVIAMLESSQEVEVLQSENEWSQVRLSDGKEGWVLSRLLTSDKPKILLLDQTVEKNQALMRQVSDLTNENKELAEINKKIENELAQLKKKLQETSSAYETLQKESAEFLTLQSKYEKSTRELETFVNKTDELDAEIKRLTSRQNILWFSVGAGVLLLGFLLGLIVKRQPRRYVL